MNAYAAREGLIRVRTDPDTGRDLIELRALAQLATDMALTEDPAELLGAVMRCGAEVLMAEVEQAEGDVREAVMVRMPDGWRELVALYGDGGPKL